MPLDFSKLPLPKIAKAQTDPFKIFANLPRVSGAPNDLWRGQAQALTEWDGKRESLDTLISLNTGAGKTLVGLLVAKSFCNEGLENVLYVCPTNDLVAQTAQQARNVGIEVTTRTGANFDNDLFETGKTFCITNYHSVLNGFSALRKRFFPDAIIFDDAHVAEAMMRSAYTIQLSRLSHKKVFDELVALLAPHFAEIGAEMKFQDACSEKATPQTVLVPPQISIKIGSQVSAILRAYGIAEDDNLKYAYEHLKDKMDRCAIVVRNSSIEITPPFLPSLTMDIFSQKIRRVYLSATLHNKADIVRAFGRNPSNVIEPANDAGNGERLIIFERGLKGQFDKEFVGSLLSKHKVVLSVPTYKAAENWSDIAVPATHANFSSELESFRRSRSGAFVLVSRVDGIDLPHATCRLMLIDGTPIGDSLLEKFQFELLHMRSFAASRTANRLVQLFGRINRGRSDYGAFLIAGHGLNVWLNKDKNVALLPDLLRNQILLGRHVQDGMSIKKTSDVTELLETVLLSEPRDQAWLDYYSQFLEATEIAEETTERAMKAEARNFEAAKAEAIYAQHTWDANYPAAREALDNSVAETARADEKLAGWHNLWIAACLHHEGDDEEAYYYNAQARGQLGPNLVVYTGPVGNVEQQSVAGRTPIVERLFRIANLGRESFNKQMRTLNQSLRPLDGATPRQMEEAVRQLGEMLGFVSTRPDNEFDTGPDVLWIDTQSGSALGIELKTDKAEGSSYSKDDISQSLDHLSWMSNNVTGADILGVTLVGKPSRASDQANPVSELYHAQPEVFAVLRDKLFALLGDVYKMIPLQRLDALETSTRDGWSLPAIADQLCSNSLK